MCYLGVFVEAGKVLFDILVLTYARPALLDIGDLTLRFSHERDNVQLFVARYRKDKEMSVLRQPCYAVTREGPRGEGGNRDDSSICDLSGKDWFVHYEFASH